MALPIIYGITISINAMSVLTDGSKCEFSILKFSEILMINPKFFFLVLGLQNTPTWISFLISFLLMIIATFIIQFYVVPSQKVQAFELQRTLSVVEGLTGDESDPVILNLEHNRQIVDQLFHFLQILSAVFTSFEHGGI